ncbi:CocE/NonD family hydrolase [Streptomyces sp. SD31]|uniref:CocE/NonD family hydrolase n=1 Tax=Streptomyces sp. SD31 TaxID=3452208 RepID=UPI003F898AF8
MLRADVYRPGGTGPWPVLLSRLPYGKHDIQAYAEDFALHGDQAFRVHRSLQLVPEHRAQQRTARAFPGAWDRRPRAVRGGRPRHGYLIARPGEDSSLSEKLQGPGRRSGRCPS